MTTVADDLDLIQSRLHDSGVLWTRAELLRYYNDGFKELISKSAAVTRLTILDVPGRFASAITFNWEDRHASGTFNLFTFPCKGASLSGTYLWESQQVQGVTPVNSQDNSTQLWEIVYLGTVDNHFRFALPRSHDHVKRIAYDDELLFPVSVRELDYSDRIWFRSSGQPRWWTPGVGRTGTFEIYEIRVDYQQGYNLVDFKTGIPRQFTGSRTYAIDSGSTGYGLIREIVSPDRQYLPISYGISYLLFCGTIRDFKSSENAVLVTETVIPDADLSESNTPDMIPDRMRKYIRYYVLGIAYGREGEGKRPDLSAHYMMRFRRGIAVLSRMADITHVDRIYMREETMESSARPPRVRLPVHYPQVLY